VTGSLSYVEQEPIVFSDTIRNNITFGRKFHQTRYDRAVRLSCLISDFELLENGDGTVVGEKGITLSGGQKARLSLARSLFADADVYLFDDPLSAVDSKVAKQIHEKCLLPLKQQKTVILVTHQISYLYDCDQVIIMNEGSVEAKGSPRQLRTRL
jgi:ATP-binding cassette subfamily C (CFTR/MRP) protein 4